MAIYSRSVWCNDYSTNIRFHFWFGIGELKIARGHICKYLLRIYKIKQMTNKKQQTTKDLFSKINYLNRKISKYKKNITMLIEHNNKSQAKLRKIPNFVKFIFGIKNH